MLFTGLYPNQFRHGKFHNLAFYDVDGLKRSFGIKDKALVVGSVGRLVPIKGHRFDIGANIQPFTAAKR
jgi:hypothetical protein